MVSAVDALTTVAAACATGVAVVAAVAELGITPAAAGLGETWRPAEAVLLVVPDAVGDPVTVVSAVVAP